MDYGLDLDYDFNPSGPTGCNTFANTKTLQMIYKYENISEVLEGKQSGAVIVSLI